MMGKKADVVNNYIEGWGTWITVLLRTYKVIIAWLNLQLGHDEVPLTSFKILPRISPRKPLR